MTRKTPEILRTQTVARSRLFRVERLDLRFSNGTETAYERMASSPAGAVLVVPVLDGATVLLIREYAAGTHRYELGFPKGRVEAGEDMLAAANRELMEEVGYGAGDLCRIASVTLAPGYMGHTTHVILARGLYRHRLPGDEPEEIEVVPWPLAGVAGLLARADFTEARSIAALFLAREALATGSAR